MKKVIVALIILVALVFSLIPDAMVWCKRMILDAPTTHKIEPGEYLSKISQQYYGTAKYWQELALINRAPDSDLVFPGEEIFIPSQEVIEQLHRARSLSRVNNLMSREKALFANADEKNEPGITPTTQPEETETAIAKAVADSNIIAKVTVPKEMSKANQKSSTSGWLFAGLGLAIIFLGVIAFILIRKVKESRDQAALDNLKPVTVETENEDEEPDYQEYRKNRSERLYVE